MKGLKITDQNYFISYYPSNIDNHEIQIRLLSVKFKGITDLTKIKINIFRQNPLFRCSVDNLINIIPIETFTFCYFINKLITSYPRESVDKENDCSKGINLVDLGYSY